MPGSITPGDPPSSAKGEGESSRARFALLTSLGIMFPVSITLGGAIGYFLDRKLGTLPWFSGIFLLFGIVAAFVNLFRTLAKFETLDDAAEQIEKNESGPTENGPS
jgi:ATP synthase protein I